MPPRDSAVVVTDAPSSASRSTTSNANASAASVAFAPPVRDARDLERRPLRLSPARSRARDVAHHARSIELCVMECDRVERFAVRDAVLTRAREHARSRASPNVLVIESDDDVDLEVALRALVKEMNDDEARASENEGENENEGEGEVKGEGASNRARATLALRRAPGIWECDAQHAMWVECERMKRANARAMTVCEMPKTAEGAPRAFYAMMEELASDASDARAVVVVVDDLDAVDGLRSVKMSDWLPATMPSRLRVIIGARARGAAVNYLASGGDAAAKIVKMTLKPLDEGERKAVARGYFSDARESLITGETFENIVSHKDAGLQEYLFLAAHELRRRVRNRQRRPETPLNVDSELRYLPQTCDTLISAIFDDLQSAYGFENVRQCMALLVLSRNGLTLTELSEISRLSINVVSTLTDDISHLFWCHGTNSTFACVPKGALVLRSSRVIDYVRGAYCIDKEYVAKVQRDAALYFLVKVHNDSLDFQSRYILEVLHLVRNGKWAGAPDALLGYITDLHVIQYMWNEGYRSDLLLCWQSAIAASDKTGRHPMQVVVEKLIKMKTRTADNLAASVSEFLMWNRAYPQVVTILELVCNRPNSAQNYTVSLNIKFGRALRYMSEWSKSIAALKIAYSAESSNFSGKTPAGATALNEMCLSVAQTTNDFLSIESHGFKGTKAVVQASIDDALRYATASLDAWKFCLEDESEGFINMASVAMNVVALYALRGDRANESKTGEQLLVELEAKLGAGRRAIYSHTKHMASIFAKNNEWAKAEFCLEETLAYAVTAFPEDSLALLENLIALADLFAEKKDYVSAEEVYTEVLSKLAATVGDDSEIAADANSKAARVAHALKKSETAKTMFIKALDITTSRFGKMYRGVAKRMMDLAAFHLDVGQLNEAKTLYTQALEIETHILGSEQPDLAIIGIALARVHKQKQDSKGAFKLCKEAEKRLHSVSQEEFPELGVHLCSIGLLYKELNHLDKAEAMLTRAVKTAEHDYFKQADLMTFAIHLGDLYKIQLRWPNAKKCFEQALKAAEATFGDDDVAVAARCIDLGGTLIELKLFAEAQPLFVRARDIRQEKVGREHPDTQACYAVLTEIAEHVKGLSDEVSIKAVEPLAKLEMFTVNVNKNAAVSEAVAEEDKRRLRSLDLDAATKRVPAVVEERPMDAVQLALNKVAELTKAKLRERTKKIDEVVIAPDKNNVQESVRTSKADIQTPEEFVETLPAKTILEPSSSASEFILNTPPPSPEMDKMDDIGNVDGFLAEFVEYLGHRQYRFKLDDKVFATFSLVREHLEKNYRRECQLWSRGEKIEPPAPLLRSVIKLAPIEVKTTSRSLMESPQLQETATTSPIVESPRSQDTALSLATPESRGIVESPQSQDTALSLATPQSRSIVEPRARPNELATVSMQQYEYTLARIGSLESQLAEMREMMQRLLYERQSTAPYANSQSEYARHAQRYDYLGPRAQEAPQQAQFPLASWNVSPPSQSEPPREAFVPALRKPSTTEQSKEATKPLDEKAHSSPETSPMSLSQRAGDPSDISNGKIRLLRLGGPSARTMNAATFLKPPIAKPKTLKTKLPSETALDLFMKNSTDDIGHRRIRCRLDGISLSTHTLMRAHYERCHLDDAASWFDKRQCESL